MAAIIPCDIPAHRWDDALHVACSTFKVQLTPQTFFFNIKFLLSVELKNRKIFPNS